MNIYIALLRGINVSGQKKIKMAELKSLMVADGFKDVQSYIQSGNIVFKSSKKKLSIISTQLEKLIESNFSFHVPVLILTPTELLKAKNNNAYLKDESKDNSKISFTFLYTTPIPENIAKLLGYNFPEEDIMLMDNMVYLHLINGAGRAKLTNNFIENKLKVTASSRNYNTVLKLIEMSKSE
jgi:uncharacterized protein (DUF1697 family)